MSASALRARRLVSGGWVLLLTPVAWLLAVSLVLVLQPVPVLSQAAWVVTALWAGSLAVGVGGTSLRRPRSPDQPDPQEAGVTVSAEDQPELWRLVRDAAWSADLPVPDEVRLTAVGEVTAWPGRRTRLDIGVPVLFVLDRPAVGALVARALAVADSGWADASLSVDRFRWVLQRLAGRQLPGGVATLLLRRLDLQRAEGILEADDVATRVAGRPTVGRALAWSHVAHIATQWWFDEHVRPGMAAGMQPRPLLAGLEALVSDPHRQRELMRAVSSRLPAGDGAVPGLADRVYGLQTGAAVPDLLPGVPAAETLRAPSQVLEEVAEAWLGHAERPQSWPESLDAWALRTSQSSAAILADHGPDLASVLDGVAEKRLGGWVRDAVRDASVDADELGCFLLSGLLVRALVDSGAGRAVAGWSGAIDVVSPDGVALDVPRAARMVIEDPDLVPELRRMLTELGVRLSYRPAAEGRHGPLLAAFHRTAGPRRLPGTGFPGLEEAS